MTEMLSVLFWLLAGHFIGDFPFQNEWMVVNKGKSWEINFYHSAVYAFTVLITAKIGGLTLSPGVVVIILASHFIIEPFKARWKIIPHIWQDQALHIAVLVFMAISAINAS